LNNSFHALKLSFANEMGRLCNSLQIDGHELMKLFTEDSSLNISSAYFKPGAPYGGSCLPKDLKALNTLAHDSYLDLPILQSIDSSNSIHSDHIYNEIVKKKVKDIGIFGLSFKANTDDLRFSPSLLLCEKLIGKGYNLTIYDSNINLSKLIGKNKLFLEKSLPHIDELMVDHLDVFFKSSELFIISHKTQELIESLNLLHSKALIFDLVKIDELSGYEGYEGLCW